MVLINDMDDLCKRFEHRYEILFIFTVEVGLKFLILATATLILRNACLDILTLFREE